MAHQRTPRTLRKMPRIWYQLRRWGSWLVVMYAPKRIQAMPIDHLKRRKLRGIGASIQHAPLIEHSLTDGTVPTMRPEHAFDGRFSSQALVFATPDAFLDCAARQRSLGMPGAVGTIHPAIEVSSKIGRASCRERV